MCTYIIRIDARYFSTVSCRRKDGYVGLPVGLPLAADFSWSPIRDRLLPTSCATEEVQLQSRTSDQSQPMKRKQKKRLVARFTDSIHRFYQEVENSFMCPTCLRLIPVDNMEMISEAHILPRVAGGRLTTLACRSCNSTFGHRQDKWFGEYLRLLKNPQATILHTRHQKGHFHIEGVRVGGNVRVAPSGDIEILIDVARTEPGALQHVRNRAAAGDLGTIGIPIPLLANERLIDVGSITAAYLLWFKALGYSWALQHHLDAIREVILNPKSVAFPKCIVRTEKTFPDPWIGIGKIGDELFLLAGVGRALILFPPVDDPVAYGHLPPDFSGMTLTDYRRLQFPVQMHFDGPMGVIYRDRIVICPDVLMKGREDSRFLLFPPGDGLAKMLYPVSKEDIQLLESEASVVKVKAQRQLLISPHETGRPGRT